MAVLSFMAINFYLLFSYSKVSAAADTITSSQNLTDGKTLISKNGSFELGFFSPGQSNNRYMGMWYKNIPVQTIVWVANRQKPIKDLSGLLLIDSSTGNLVLSQNKTVVWAATLKRKAQNPVLQLLDSGNLVLREANDENSENFLWQSFDYPSDTLLPGMKLGKDFRNCLDRQVTAWKNQYDPSPGNLTWAMKVNSYPEPLMWQGSKKVFRSGPWNGVQYSGKPTFRPHPIFDFRYFNDGNEVYYMILLVNKSKIARMTVNQTTNSQHHLVWLEAKQRWDRLASVPRDFCDSYGACGPNGNCNIKRVPSCECLRGFKSKSPERWNALDYSEGCVRNKLLNCKNDGFVKYIGMKVPDTTNSWLNERMTRNECREECLNNCSCMAYTNSDIRDGGSGCVMWFDDLNDLRVQPDAGQDLYVRVPASELENNDGLKWKIGVILGSASVIISAMLVVLCYRCRSRKNLKADGAMLGYTSEEQKEDLDLPFFDLSKITTATNNFSMDNKLGEGGFGPVYKGKLGDGQEIAVKRLSRSSGQGLNEFKNEVILIAKLQHRNLVKLLGCCIQDEEKLLVYEYMPNKSLDSFIFDQTQRRLLVWSRRHDIICGIARGLLYLHQDSRLRIIHRDIKASNVLLDSEMNPKISDFGLARAFGGDQSAANTEIVVGTYGYMAPEYAMDGNFSTKSDVFSFGILLLEIVTGKKNSGFYCPNDSLNLIEYAWNLWREERPLELIDEYIEENCNLSEVHRCIHISLLCLEQHPQDRPSMSSVVVMLGSDAVLPQLRQPGFFIGEHLHGESSSPFKNSTTSVNGLSNTVPEAR
ncbi:S-receptor-like serine/threonine-protein kinase [Quillaja saponaria]|uniref:Receptor-like serine/threonine-protein kinase n=1 Tax=Quillaja saponaria TaxID=32244 RepID=A0AAD7KZ91_QUISA|nr:S-receptor-like serine/threonine-protein kinase [Quillaja saponaria]